MRAVGWLEPPFTFQTGGASDALVARLKSLLDHPWEPIKFMGGQFCGFCEGEVGYSAANVFIPAGDVVYVAPQGIIHYMEDHRYVPPAEFQLAVERCPPFDSVAYYEALIAAGLPVEDAEASCLQYRQRVASIERADRAPQSAASAAGEVSTAERTHSEAEEHQRGEPVTATRDSWRRGEARGPLTPIPYEDLFTESEWRLLQRGLVPQAMEEKWFVYCEGLTLFLHRSWTGDLYYEVELGLRRGRATVVRASRVDHPDGPSWNDSYHAEILRFLLRGVLLRQPVAFPLLSAEESLEGVFQHHVSGTALPERVLPSGGWHGWRTGITAWTRRILSWLP